jgi:hypothetical protein
MDADGAEPASVGMPNVGMPRAARKSPSDRPSERQPRLRIPHSGLGTLREPPSDFDSDADAVARDTLNLAPHLGELELRARCPISMLTCQHGGAVGPLSRPLFTVWDGLCFSWALLPKQSW